MPMQTMFYLDTETLTAAYREIQEGRPYESFTPTKVDLETVGAAWGVVVEYTTYDSFKADDTPRFEVLDLYETQAAAREVIAAALNHSWPYEAHARRRLIPAPFWLDWGNTLSCFHLVKIRLIDAPERYEITRYGGLKELAAIPEEKRHEA